MPVDLRRVIGEDDAEPDLRRQGIVIGPDQCITGDDEVEALRSLFAGVPLRINLIDVNDARPDGYRRATPSELASFRDSLRSLEVPVVRRYSGGAAKHAACGMLAAGTARR